MALPKKANSTGSAVSGRHMTSITHSERSQLSFQAAAALEQRQQQHQYDPLCGGGRRGGRGGALSGWLVNFPSLGAAADEPVGDGGEEQVVFVVVHGLVAARRAAH